MIHHNPAVADTALVACNIYISSASRRRLAPLFRLAQSHTSALLVHTFVDHSYNRSSFHWTGAADAIATVATSVAQSALDDDELELEDASLSHPHPTVGKVDHIAVLPLASTNTSASEAAKCIGSSLMAHILQCRVVYYGGAHPNHHSLAEVRRNETDFFRSVSSLPTSIVTVVGSPPFFVENYNLRLEDKQMARLLMRRLRTRDGGLPHVEALTLPYARDQWEVACNLNQPQVTNVRDVDTVVDAFCSEHNLTVERYRVGTTAEQCRRAWETTANSGAELKRKQFDEEVKEQFEAYFE